MPARHLLIGSGPGAMAAAESIRRADGAAVITMVTAERDGYYSRPGLAYYLAKEEPESALAPFTAKELRDLGIETVVARADHVDASGHTVTLHDGRVLPYDRLLLATGSRAIPARVPGAELDGVTKLDDLADARDLARRAGSGRTAVVIGGGITALEIAEGLNARGTLVHYFMRKDRYWSNVLSETESRLVEAGLKSLGVKVHFFTELDRILGEGGRVTGVETADGAHIACDLVGVAIGVAPARELAEAAGLDCARGMLVDRTLRSSDPDIFGAGDIAEVRGADPGRGELEVLWNTAVAKGRVAGQNMATDGALAYDAGVPLNVTRIGGYRVTIIGAVGSGRGSDLEGLSRGDSENWGTLGEAVTIETETERAHLRLALGGDTITGAVVMGDQELSFPLQDLIAARADVSAIAAPLQASSARAGELVRGFWNDWRSRGV